MAAVEMAAVEMKAAVEKAAVERRVEAIEAIGPVVVDAVVTKNRILINF